MEKILEVIDVLQVINKYKHITDIISYTTNHYNPNWVEAYNNLCCIVCEGNSISYTNEELSAMTATLYELIPPTIAKDYPSKEAAVKAFLNK